MLGLDLPTFISRAIILVIAFTVHEFSHAATATAFGDPTPRNSGRLTLNPLSHLDVFGSIMLILAGFGWAKPVPVNPYQLSRRSPAALMLVSLAGPLSNLVLALLAAIPLRLGLVPHITSSRYFPSPFSFLIEFMFVNLLLTLFNLIPLAPLDGDKIADYFFPPSIARVFEVIRPYGPIILLALLFIGPTVGIDLVGTVIYPPIVRIMQLLIG